MIFDCIAILGRDIPEILLGKGFGKYLVNESFSMFKNQIRGATASWNEFPSYPGGSSLGYKEFWQSYNKTKDKVESVKSTTFYEVMKDKGISDIQYVDIDELLNFITDNYIKYITMDIEIKEIIDELIHYEKERAPKEHLQNAFNTMGDRQVYSLVGFLLLWHKLVFLDLELPEKYDLSDLSVLQEKYTRFFEECPPLKKVFKINKDYIGWADNLTKEEQEDIRNYIHSNHKVQVRIRRGRKEK